MDLNDLDSCTSLGGIDIRMLGFVIQVSYKASVAQLVRALLWNRRAVGSIPTRGPCAAFFAVVPG